MVSKTARNYLCPGILTLTCATLAIPLATAQEPDLSKVDSVLDRLEKRLLDEESDGMSYADSKEPVDGEKSEKIPSKKFLPEKISGANPDATRLKSLSSAISDLEGQIDQLTSNIQKTRQSVIDDAAIDNFTAIEAHLVNGDTSAVKKLRVTVDGFEVYSLMDPGGLWLPAKLLPLYSGPMQPGTHKVEIEATVVSRTRDAIAVAGDLHRTISKSFTLSIPHGAANNRYVISVTVPESPEGQADAVLKESI